MQKSVYTVAEIQEMLYLSKNVAYNLVKEAARTKEFVVVKVGTMYRIPCEPFDKWLYQKQNVG